MLAKFLSSLEGTISPNNDETINLIGSKSFRRFLNPFFRFKLQASGSMKNSSAQLYDPTHRTWRQLLKRTSYHPFPTPLKTKNPTIPRMSNTRHCSNRCIHARRVSTARYHA